MSFNPYAPPTVGYQEYYGADPYEQPLASLGSRFVAWLPDALLGVAVALPGLIWFFISMQDLMNARYTPYGSSSYEDPTERLLLGMIGPMMLMIVPGLALSIYQWILISKQGQTLGKKWMNIRIIRTSGQPVDFVSGVLLRSWVMGFLSGIPYIGGCIALVDILFIFSDDRQCLHDKIASTKVIAVAPGSA